MDVSVALEFLFYKTPDGKVWSPNIFGYSFWERYLNPHKLDEIRKLAEQSKADEATDLEPESLIDNPGWGSVAC